MTSESADRVPSVLVCGRTVQFEATPCSNCGSARGRALFEGPDRFLGLPGTFRVVRCLECGLVRQNPRPTAETIDAYYPAAYEPYAGPIADEPSPLRRFDRWYGMYKRRRLIERRARSGRLLDVGAATGNFLAEMARTGRWQVAGIEPNPHAVRVARDRLRLDVRPGRVSEVDFPPESFDVVTLWNVLEHLHDPIGDLRRLARILRPGGWLVFSIPNLECIEARVFGDRWFGWELPRHLYFFPKAVLGRLLTDLGLELRSSVCLSGGQLSVALSLKYLYGARSPRRWNRLAASALSSPPLRILGMPTFHVLSQLRQSMIITHVAQKV